MDSTMPLAKAEKQSLGSERLREQLGRLGGTPFKLGEFEKLSSLVSFCCAQSFEPSDCFSFGKGIVESIRTMWPSPSRAISVTVYRPGRESPSQWGAGISALHPQNFDANGGPVRIAGFPEFVTDMNAVEIDISIAKRISTCCVLRVA